MKDGFLTLGIETSCDETSAAVLKGGDKLLSNVISSQIDVHKLFGGVVPEVAARKHVEVINTVIDEALEKGGVRLNDIDLIAVTAGPGLAISLVVGIAAAKTISYSMNIPAIGVNHLEGHIMANMLSDKEHGFPAVCLLVSGGHTEIISIAGPGEYSRLGGTVDDAAGEAFDKVSRLLGLGYPGGPVIQSASEKGDAAKITFPRPMLREPNFNFSFSGLKTAVLNFTKQNDIGDENAKISVNDVAVAFQEAVVDVLTQKTIRAAIETGAGTVWLAGGVAANRPLRESFKTECEKNGIHFSMPDFLLCTDNAGMIARTGYEIFRKGGKGLELSPQPVCPL